MVIEELAYTGGRAVWTHCMETSEMNCWLRTSTVGGERVVELATYCCDYAFTGFAPIAGGGLIVYRAQASGRLMQVTASGTAVALAMPRLLLGARPLATDGTRIAFFARKMVYVVDRRGHVIAHWSLGAPGVEAAFAQDRLVLAPSWTTAALLVYDLRTGKSSRVTLTPKTQWGHHFVGASGNLVAYLVGKLAKDQYGNVVWTATRVQLVRLPDGRTVTVANIKGGSSTFGADGLLVASGAPPDIHLITWAKLQTLLQRG